MMRCYVRAFTLLLYFLFKSALAYAVQTSDPINATVEIFADTGKQIQVGSGFFISSKGDIATAYHVISGAKSLQVISHQGSFTHFEIKAYDPSLDLAIISVFPLGVSPIDFLPTESPPSTLLSKSGIVVGHPDLKKDFSVRVSFPRDRPLLSGEWATATQGTGTRWIFARSDVKLIAIDGTLNHGMSGGPLIVNGKAVGVFSGGEENSGGGLGWAISAEYIASLPKAAKGTSLEALPPLALLTENSAKPALMKAVQTPFGKEFFPKLMTLAMKKSSMLAYGPIATEMSKGFVECESYLNSVTAGTERKAPASGSNEQACLVLVAAASRVFVAAMQAFSDYAVAGTAATGDAIVSQLEKRISTAGTLDVKQGFFRAVSDVGSRCNVGNATNQARKIFDEDAARLQRATAPLQKIPPFPPPDITASSNADQIAEKVFQYLEHEYGKTLVFSLSQIFQQIPAFLESVASVYAPWTGCMEALMRVIDFQPDIRRSNEHVDVDQLNAVEKSYFMGIYFGFYYGTLAMVDGCQKRFGPISGLDEGVFRFKQRNLLYVQRATEIGTQSMSQADFDDLMQTAAKMIPTNVNKILDDMEKRNFGAPFCKSIAKHMDENNIAVTNPDTAEVISGEAVDRGKLPNAMMTLQHAFADTFASVFQKNIQTGSSLLSTALPDFIRLSLRVWENNLVLQCRQMASPLPQSADLALSQIGAKNDSEIRVEKENLSRKILAAGADKSQMDALWSNLNVEANELNQTFMREFNIQTSSNLLTACISFLNPDVQERIATLLATTKTDLGAALAD